MNVWRRGTPLAGCGLVAVGVLVIVALGGWPALLVLLAAVAVGTIVNARRDRP